jgi:hypothetical protein
MALLAHPRRPELVGTSAGTKLIRWSLDHDTCTQAFEMTLNGPEEERRWPHAVDSDGVLGFVVERTEDGPWEVELRSWNDFALVSTIRTPTPHAAIRCLQFSPDGRWIAVGVGASLLLFDRTRNGFVSRVDGGGVSALGFDSSCRHLAAIESVYEGAAVLRILEVGEEGLRSPRDPLRRPASGAGFEQVSGSIAHDTTAQLFYFYLLTSTPGQGWHHHLLAYDSEGRPAWDRELDTSWDRPRAGDGYGATLIPGPDGLLVGAVQGRVLVIDGRTGNELSRLHFEPGTGTADLARDARNGIWALVGDGPTLVSKKA